MVFTALSTARTDGTGGATMTPVAVTMYLLHTSVLFCDVVVDADTPPWIAMPVSQHGITWQCGDRIAVNDGDVTRYFTALDAGPFGAHCVLQPGGDCLPIAADVPEPWAWFDGLSTVGRVWNVSKLQREWSQFQ